MVPSTTAGWLRTGAADRGKANAHFSFKPRTLCGVIRHSPAAYRDPAASLDHVAQSPDRCGEAEVAPAPSNTTDEATPTNATTRFRIVIPSPPAVGGKQLHRGSGTKDSRQENGPNALGRRLTPDPADRLIRPHS
ncbi:hypothetical protein GCM10009634_32890 [Saccharothrix xinjiangensis]